MVQTWVLKVSIHCEGCKKKLQRVLHRVEGVFSVDIDSSHNRVTVTGDVDAESLIRKLLKYGKHSELIQDENRATTNSSYPAPVATDNNSESKGEEKGSAILETEQKQHAAEPPLDVATSEEVSSPKPNGDAVLKSETNDSDTIADMERRKKGKEVMREESGDEEEAAYDSGPLPSNPFMNRQPLYTMSYNTAHPSANYAYYDPPPAMTSSYGYSYPPPAGNQTDYYSSESYYRSIDPAASSAGSYDLFSEENPNACNLM